MKGAVSVVAYAVFLLSVCAVATAKNPPQYVTQENFPDSEAPLPQFAEMKCEFSYLAMAYLSAAAMCKVDWDGLQTDEKGCVVHNIICMPEHRSYTWTICTNKCQ